jgi:GR25 family glycosyltransferase involved in LPS biosynthesis
VQKSKGITVGVGAGVAATRPRLLAALESVLPVRFVPGDADRASLDALIAARADAVAEDLPVLRAAGDEEPDGRPQRSAVRFAQDATLDPRLRGSVLSDAHLRPLSEDPDGAAVLARCGDAAVWTRRGSVQDVGVLPAELGPDEALRERLEPGRCFALLALVHFLREVSAVHAWTPPPLRAAFVFDDPNLHWPSYGHLRYGDVAAHAREHRYHLAVAMVPLDGWLVHPKAARTFREAPDRLSILVHGNDHIAAELARPASADQADHVVAGALRRIAAFEQRARIGVSRVMAPPHERIAAPMMEALQRAGFEGVCMTRPYPWLQGEGMSWLTRPAEAGAATGFGPHEVVGGLPVLLRRSLETEREDLVLRAFLDQPLILYGHHEDVATGLDGLAQAAADVNRLGDVTWASLADIARTSMETRREGRVLHVRPGARRLRIAVPEGVDEVRLAPAAVLDAGTPVSWRRPDGAWAPGGHDLTVEAPGVIEAVMRPASGPDDRRSASPTTTLWPLARRVASESRDRIRPFAQRAAARRA